MRLLFLVLLLQLAFYVSAETAVANYEKADLTNIYVKYSLGLAYAGFGQTGKAKKQFEEVAHFNFNTVEFALVRNLALENQHPCQGISAPRLK